MPDEPPDFPAGFADRCRSSRHQPADRGGPQANAVVRHAFPTLSSGRCFVQRPVPRFSNAPPATRFQTLGIQCHGPEGTRSSTRDGPIRVAFPQDRLFAPLGLYQHREARPVATLDEWRRRSATPNPRSGHSRTLDTTQTGHSQRCANPSPTEGHSLSPSLANTKAIIEAKRASTTGTFGASGGSEPHDPNRS